MHLVLKCCTVETVTVSSSINDFICNKFWIKIIPGRVIQIVT